LCEALRWFFTDTIAICSTVVPYFLLCARKTSANISGIGAERLACDGAASRGSAASGPRCIFSNPTANATSTTPARTAITAW